MPRTLQLISPAVGKERNHPAAVTFTTAAWDEEGEERQGGEGSHYHLPCGPKLSTLLVHSDRPLGALWQGQWVVEKDCVSSNMEDRCGCVEVQWRGNHVRDLIEQNIFDVEVILRLQGVGLAAFLFKMHQLSYMSFFVCIPFLTSAL